MKLKIIIGTILLSSSAAHAFDYSEVINRNQRAIGHNSAYAKAEEAYADRLNNAKRQLARDVERYRKAHIAAMKSDARVRALEANMPAHRAYRSDWANGTTDISWRAE